MLSYRLGTVKDFHWEFKPVLHFSKPHNFSSVFGEEKLRKSAFTDWPKNKISKRFVITLHWLQRHEYRLMYLRKLKHVLKQYLNYWIVSLLFT